MTSDERHREVAERLREYDVAEFKESAIVPFLECLGYGYKNWRGIIDELADLIDPTCKLRFDSVHQDFVCTHCGAWFDGFQTFDGHGGWHDMRFCPHCGARVVGR